MGAPAQWRHPGDAAPTAGVGAGLSARHYLVADDRIVASAVVPQVSAALGLSWTARPWLEVASTARLTVDLLPTTVERGDVLVRQGAVAGAFGVELVVHRTIP